MVINLEHRGKFIFSVFEKWVLSFKLVDGSVMSNLASCSNCKVIYANSEVLYILFVYTACGDGVVRVFRLDDASSKSFKYY